MTKDYHLTPEQAEEIWSEVESNRGFSADLAAFANAVLDEVLGEPVARLMLGNMQSPRIAVDINNPMKPVFCEPLLEVGTELYAPKGLK